jgi:hypothetical protein
LERHRLDGDEAAGGYWGNNSGRMSTMTLPNSQQQFRFPFFGYFNAVDGDDALKRRGTIPDVACRKRWIHNELRSPAAISRQPVRHDGAGNVRAFVASDAEADTAS